MQLAELYSSTSGEERRGCKTCQWYESLDDPDRKFFDEKAEEGLENRGNIHKLHRAIVASGFKIARSSLHTHIHEHHRTLSERLRSEAADQ